MDFPTGTRIGLAIGPGPIIAGTVLDNDGDGVVTVQLDDGRNGTVSPGMLYALTAHDEYRLTQQ